MGGRPFVRVGDAAKTKMVFAGNSIVNGGGDPVNSWWAKLSLLSPINGAYTVTNLGHDGWYIPTLDAAGDTSPQFVNGKTNVLLFYEGTNSLKGGNNSVSSTVGFLQTYITNRLAEHPWKIVLVSTLPFVEGATGAGLISQNQAVDQFNAAMKANYKAWGAVGYVDVRTGAPWGSMPDYTIASFQAAGVSALFNPDLTHPNAAGNQMLADLMAPQLRRIPLR